MPSHVFLVHFLADRLLTASLLHMIQLERETWSDPHQRWEMLLVQVLLFAELRVYVVAGTVAQWYFQPPGSNSTKVLTAL